MPTDSYTFRLTISGAEAITQARTIRKEIEAEFKQVTMIDLGNVPEAVTALTELKKGAQGVGRALTAGFRAQVGKLIEQIIDLQTAVNQVVRAGAGPVEKALEGLGTMGLDALEIVDAGSTKATQKMARLTNTIRGAQTQIEQMQKSMAELGDYPLVPAGGLGEVRTLNELFKTMTGYKAAGIRKLFRDMEKDLAPATAELEKMREAARAEATPAVERLKAELEELTAESKKLVEEQAQIGRFAPEYAQLKQEIELYGQAIIQVEKELSKLTTIMMTGGMGEETSKLRLQQEQYLSQLKESTVWWKELTTGAGKHKDVVEAVAKVDEEAASRLAQMVSRWETMRSLQTSISRGIGTMQRMGDKIELPPGTEGTLATLVLVEKSLGQSTELATVHVLAQGKALGKLVTKLDQAAQAAQGLDRTQREALRRIQMTAEARMRGATSIRAGLTVEQAGAAIVPILAQVDVQAEAIKNRALGLVAELEQEGRRRKPFGWLIEAARAARRMIVGESIIPEMVTAINVWLAKIGIEEPFDVLAMDAKSTAEFIKQMGRVAQEEAKQTTATVRAEARVGATARIEAERRLTAQLKGEEGRRTTDHQDEIRKRQQAEREARRARMEPTAAELQRYGGGMMGAISWSVQEAQMRQMGMRMLTADVQRLSRSLTIAGAAMTGPPILAMRRFVEYTRETNRAGRAMGLAQEESDALRHVLIEQSQAMGMVKPEEMASGLYMWATGVGATARTLDELKKVIEDTIPIQELAYMHQIELGHATETTAGILGEYGLEVSETTRVVNILDATADRTFATVADLGEAFKMVGPIAHQLGVSVEETAAALGVLSDSNIRGTMAGRAMRQLFIRLTKTTEKEDEVLNRLLKRNKELGQSWRDLVFPDGKFIGLAKWVDLLAAATENLNDEERAAVLSTIATANELPALTAMVMKQIQAREHGINVIRAEEKILVGAVDSEVEAYARWEEQITGNIMGLESAAEGRQRKLEDLADDEAFQLDKLEKQWDAAMMAMGEATMVLFMPSIEKATDVMEDLSDFIIANPWVAQAILAAGGALAAVGIMGTVAVSMLRIMTMMRVMKDVMAGWLAAKQLLAAEAQAAAAAVQTTAASGQAAAAVTQAEAAGVQATAASTQAAGSKTLLAGLWKILLPLLAVVGGFEAGRLVTEQVRGEPLGRGEALGEIGTFVGQLMAMTAGTGGMLTAWLLGEDPAEAFEIATYEAAKLLGLIEEVEDETWKTSTNAERLQRGLMGAEQAAAGLNREMMQVSEAAATGLAVFTEAELAAIDELEEYLRSRDDLIEQHNEDLAEIEEEFLEQQQEFYQDYLADRAKLLDELREVTEEALWKLTEEARKALKRQAEAIEEFNKKRAKAIEEYNKRIAKADADHKKKLARLAEDHEERMEDLEAKRDAKGILSERRRYRRSVRDAKEQHQEFLGSAKDRLDELLEAEEERLNEALEKERERIRELREERKRDIEEKLKELEESYLEEEQKRKADFEKRYVEKQEQNDKDLVQLEEAHARKLASIMEWEEEVRDELRKKYLGREGDLRKHLRNMEKMYREMYALATQSTYRGGYTPPAGGLQAGGYAGAGVYRMGEAGREFVLSSGTTRSMERAIGYLTQAKMLSMASAAGGGYYRFHVTADQHFSPDFARQIEAAVHEQIVDLSSSVTHSEAGAHRLH